MWNESSDSKRAADFRENSPKNYENTIYISSETSLESLLELIQDKWPDVSLEDIEISSEYIHVYCVGYDKYDPSDYISYTVIRRIKRK